MNLAFWISKRLRLNGRKSAAGVTVAVAGVALALVIMELTLSIVVGFKKAIEAKLEGFEAQISILPPIPADGSAAESAITLSSELEMFLKEELPDCDISMALDVPGLIKTDDDFQGVVFKGRRNNSSNTFERANIVEGEWPGDTIEDDEKAIVISRPLARQLGLSIGDKVYATFFVDGSIKMRRYSIAALFQSNFNDYDNSVVYAPIASLRQLMGIDNISGSSIEIRELKTDDVAGVANDLQQKLLNGVATKRFSNYYPVENVRQKGAMYFNWLELLDTNVVVIFILMAAVASLTLISSLFILILERVPMIGILRAMGASKKMVQQIFIDMAMRIVGLGLLIGNVVGIGFILVQKYTSIIPLDPEMYYINAVPVDFNPVHLLLLNLGVLTFAWLILLLPARLATAIDPSKTINFD